MELAEASEGDSPVSNVCSNGESMSSDSHLLTATTGPERRISFSYSHHQQMGFPPGEFDHSPETQQNSYQPDSCWSSRVWDQDHDHDHQHHHHPLPGRSMEAAAVAAAAELPVARADSEPKSHFWDWDNLVLLPGKVDTGKRASEWEAAAAEDEEVTGLLPREAFHIGLQSGSSKTPLPLPLPYYSSGIPGVAAIGKVGHTNLCSSEQKIHQKIIAVDNSHGKVEADRSTVGGFDTGHYSRASELRNFTLEQHDNESSWVFQNSVLMRGIEQDRRAIAEHYPNEILKRSDQQLVGEQNSGSRENSQKVFLGLGGSAVVANKAVIKTEEKDTCINGGTGSGDDFIGLKLGKRTYFGDTAAVSVGKSAGMPMVAVGPVAYCSSSGKKRGTTATQIPRCQVEGCKMDLTTAKDYHRRHKVCAMHSKTAKVIVASIEQRFCQQCSRFHLLTEFDEGKRSCRKRLAGHNERRRKPQPDPLALAPGGASMLRGDFGRLPGIHFDDHRHLHGFEDPHYLWQQLQHTLPLGYHDVNERLNYLAGNYSRFENLGSHSSLDSQLQFPAGTDRFLQSSSKPAADRLLMLSQQHPKVLSSNLEDQRINPFQQASGLMGQGLSLSPSSGTRLLGLESSTQASHAFSGISDSGCALSLLSSQPWGSMNLSSVSLGLSSKPHQVLERMFAENPTPLAQQFPNRALPGVRNDYVRTTTEPFFIQPGTQRGGTLPAGITPNAFRGNLQAPFSVVSDINDHPMLSIPHGHDSRALNDHSSRALNNHSSHQRPTIDLMELPSSHLHHSQVGPVQTVDREFLGFQSSRAFDSALYDTHAML